MPGDSALFASVYTPASNFPVGATPAKTDANVAALAMANNLGSIAGKTTYIEGICIGGLGATAAAFLTCNIAGLLGGNFVFYMNIPAGATVILTPFILKFDRPLPASGLATNIVLNVPSFGAGNTNAWSIAWGYYV